MPIFYRNYPPELLDVCFVAAMRCVLSLSVLLIVALDPLAQPSFPDLAYALLSLYAGYSVLLYLAARWWHPLLPAWVEPWVDISWALGLSVISGDPYRIFLAISFFAILITAYQWGFGAGVRVALVSVLLFIGIGWALSFARPDFELRRMLVGPASLLVLGYITASFGGRELTLRRRLALLQDVTRLTNPRFGVDRTIGMVMERLRALYDADACVLIMADEGRPGHHLRRADRRNPEAGFRAETIPEGLARLLLALPAEQAVLYPAMQWGWQRQRQHAEGSTDLDNVTQSSGAAADPELNGTLAATLGAKAFVSVPLRHHSKVVGRLYLTSTQRHAFNPSDIDFLRQVIEHTLPVIDNIRLVDRLASDAAEAERRRIAHDLHDSVIQPYIGLQMGLSAIRQKLEGHHPGSARDVDRLLELTRDEVVYLRRLVQGLKDGGSTNEGVLSAVRRYAGKFSEATGITVNVEADNDPCLSDRLAAEVFQVVIEGLSNIRRHTQATQATIGLAQNNGHLVLKIANDRAEDSVSFTPRSITERVGALGGQVSVEQQRDKNTVVVVEIPL